MLRGVNPEAVDAVVVYPLRVDSSKAIDNFLVGGLDVVKTEEVTVLGPELVVPVANVTAVVVVAQLI